MKYDSHQGPFIDASIVATAILEAAGWARVGITMPDEQMRQRAAQELALTIIEQLDPRQQPDPRQLALFR